MNPGAAAVTIGLVALLLAGCLANDPGGEGAGDDRACLPEAVETTFRFDVAPMMGQGRLGGTAVQRFPVNLTEADVQWSCLRGVGATITWTNGPGAGADLYVGLEVPGEWTVVGHDRQQLAADGTHEETVLAPVGIAGRNPASVQDFLVVTIHTDWASLSQGTLAVDAALTLYT